MGDGRESSSASAAGDYYHMSAADPRKLGVFELKEASIVMDHSKKLGNNSLSAITTTTTATTTTPHKLYCCCNDNETLKVAKENEDIGHALSCNNPRNRLFSRSDHTMASRNNCNIDKDQATEGSEEASLPLNAYDDRLKRVSCRRNLSKELEKELTFKPELNQRSVKIFSRSTRQCVPVVSRLTERRKKAMIREHDSAYTFVPHINPNSVKLAQERAGKIEEVRARIAQQAARATAELQSKYPFKPQVSQKSCRIAELLGTSFEKRQEAYMEKRRKAVVENSDGPSPKTLPHRPRRPPLTNYSLTITNTLATTPNTGTDTSSSPDSSPPKTTPPSAPNPNLFYSAAEVFPSSIRATAAAATSRSPDDGVSVECETSPTDACAQRALCRAEGNTPPRRRDQTDLSSQFRRKRAAIYGSTIGPSSKVKCKAAAAGSGGAVVKGRKSVTVAGGGGESSVGETPSSRGGGKKEGQEEAVEAAAPAISFSKIRNERDRIKYVKAMAEKKVKEKKLFLIHGGYRLVRRCLRRRGWIELDYQRNKTAPTTSTKPPKKGAALPGKAAGQRTADKEGESSDDDSDVDLDVGIAAEEEEYEDEEEYGLVARLLRNNPPNFVWTLCREAALYDSLHRSTITNHFAKASSFTTKNDLCTNLRQLMWHGDRSPDVFFPRCYCLSTSEEERDMFIDDYRFSAALNILKMVSHRYSIGHGYHSHTPRNSHTLVSALNSISSSRSSLVAAAEEEREAEAVLVVSDRAVRLALKAGEAFLASKYHDDIENSQLNLCPKVIDSEWEELVEFFYQISSGCQVNCNVDMITSVNTLLHEIEGLAPQFSMEGDRNIWIIKPGASSRGRGILCLNKLEDILAAAQGNASMLRRIGRYVVQKYIERPLLIYETKFDIRQWFLVTDWNPLTMWMYQDSYLRFSSQPYTLDSMDASIHLCNNSIQKHYKNSLSRSEELPPQNMWDSDTFQKYLCSIGRRNCWEEVIYPGMKEALVHSLQVSQGEIEHRKNCFELYGADFMICTDFHPWLIEINSSPTMEGSTEVTARLCSQVLEDTLKVVIDRRENKDCDTGRFELAFKQARVDAPPYVGMQLCVKGSAVKLKHTSKVQQQQQQQSHHHHHHHHHQQQQQQQQHQHSNSIRKLGHTHHQNHHHQQHHQQQHQQQQQSYGHQQQQQQSSGQQQQLSQGHQQPTSSLRSHRPPPQVVPAKSISLPGPPSGPPLQLSCRKALKITMQTRSAEIML